MCEQLYLRCLSGEIIHLLEVKPLKSETVKSLSEL